MASVFIQIVAWTTFVYWQIYDNSSGNVRKWYNSRKASVTFAPPGWLFGIAWFILYGLIVATAVTFFGDSDDQVAVYVLFFINIVLNKVWSPVFFGQRQLGVAAWIIVAMLGTEIAVLVLIGLAQQWLSFGLYLPYVLWTAFALALNVAFWQTRPTNVKVRARVQRRI